MNETVKIKQGTVRGDLSDGVLAFKGIPFAAPPVGALRFAPAAAPNAWDGVRDCTNYGPVSPQHLDPLSAMIPGCEWNFYHPGAVQSEDCLNLNVWAPATEASPRAVLVWIHGGAFLAGSGTGLWCDGSELARLEDVVVVTVNYRLGALGGLAWDEAGTAGNNMFTDQMAALRWVQDNIASFGGDPARVTIGGESAGAMSVCALMSMPAAAGLFSGAIVQSGHGSVTATAEQARVVRDRFLAELDISPTDDPVAHLRQLTTEQILDVQRIVAAEMIVPFRPVVDGELLPRPIDATFADGTEAPVPMLIGTNSEENRLFSAMGWGPGAVTGSLESKMQAQLGADNSEAVIADLVASYRSSGAGDDEAWDTFSNDRDWRAPVRNIAAGHARAGGPVFQYEFTYRSPVLDGVLGACHALDIPFVFGNLAQRGVDEFVGGDEAGVEARVHVETTCREAWGSFLRDATPASSLLPTWPPYRDEDRAVAMIGAVSTVAHGPHDARLDRIAALDHVVPLT